MTARTEARFRAVMRARARYTTAAFELATAREALLKASAAVARASRKHVAARAALRKAGGR